LTTVTRDAARPGQTGYERVRRPLLEDPSIDVEIALEPAAGAQPR
jgi:hypothetical protein